MLARVRDLFLFGCLLACSCSVPVASNLSESDANRVVVALENKGVAADKEADPEHEGSYRVLVARDSASGAVAVLAQESLPRPPSPGLLDALGAGGIVPSRLSEHAKLVAGTAGELEQSLLGIDGVLSARVHLALAPADALDLEHERPPVTASVLLRHQGATPPIASGEVQRLVAGAVPGLKPDHVTVVTAPSPLQKRAPEREFARFGPLTVARGSLGSLRLVVLGIALVNLVLLGLLLMAWSKWRRAEHAASSRLGDGASDDTRA